MSALQLRYEACVRSLSVSASCRTCEDVCPEGAIDTQGVRGSVRIHLDRCTSCGLCAAACPNDAFEAAFDVTAFVSSAPEALRCGAEGLPCVGALATEDLIAIASQGSRLVLHDGACPNRSPGHALAEKRAQEAQRFVDALGIAARIEWRAAEDLDAPTTASRGDRAAPPRDAPASGGRRRFLRALVPLGNADGQVREVPDRLDRARMQQVTRRRRRMLASLPASVEAKVSHLAAEEVGFTSSKEVVPERCTACAICVSVCPTGALSGPRSMREIRFDSSRCTKCGLCHDVCEPGAIRLSEETSVRAFVDLSPTRLVKLDVADCAECGARFRVNPARPERCPHCEALESELLELSGRGP